MLRVKRRTIAAFLFPMLATIAVINLWPILYTCYLSLTNYSEFNSDNYRFIGLENYHQLIFSLDSDLFPVLWQTLLYVAVCLACFLVVGLLTALALNNPRIKGLPFWRVVLLLPWAAPSGITALIWKFLFQYDFGPLNQVGRLFFGPTFGVPWLLNPTLAFISVVIVNVWLSYPFFTVVILGALQSIPGELREAARIDGAGPWQYFRNVTLPLLTPALVPALILSAITTFQMFNTVYLITQGGPIVSALRPGATEFVMIYMYNRVLGTTVANPHYGFIASFAITLFVILAALTYLASGPGSRSPLGKGTQA
ncbi:carbohydrate ABC transporter permease [Thermogemmatispora sp.]|uniref:carbohydrate ABC transporter permease n=1 Tax=Thermogemmatispora sp. TaxID=1968838 RepID=UPI0035E45AE0